MRTLKLGIIATVLLLAVACAREPVSSPPSPATPAETAAVREPAPAGADTVTAAGQEDDARYGSAPQGAAPFENYRDPDRRFFVTPLEYTGAGRSYPEPEGLETIKIGLLAPLDSPRDGVYGRAIANAAQLAVDEMNADGGYKGTPFELVVRNDNGLWGASANEIARFRYDDDVWVFVGTIDGSNTHVALRVALKAELPMVNVGSSDPTITETSIPWLLRLMVDDRAQAYALAEHIFGTLGLRRVIAFRGNERYGRMGIVELRDTARRMGHPILMERNVVAGQTEFDEELDIGMRLRPDAVVLWLDPWEAARFIKAARARGWDVPFFGASRTVRPELVDLVGEAGEGFVGVTSFDPTRDDPRLESFLRSYEKRFGAPPDDFAATAYDGMRITMRAIREAGLNRAKIMDRFIALRQWNGVLGEGKLNAVLNAEAPVYMATLHEGHFRYEKVR